MYCFLQTGNIVGVQRSPEGAMHVFVNGCDLGPAVFGVPEVCIQSRGYVFMRRSASKVEWWEGGGIFMRSKWVVHLNNYCS